MVMSVLVNEQGCVCVAHDAHYEGNPVGLLFAPKTRAITLLLDNGRDEVIGSAALPEIARRLQKSDSVMLTQRRHYGPSKRFEIPVHIEAMA